MADVEPAGTVGWREAPAETQPAGGGGEATELQLAADSSGALAFDATSLEAPAGAISIVLTNESSTPHNVAIESADGTVIAEGEIFSGGGTRTTTAELEAGTFNQSQSDLSGEVSFDEESADAGTFTFERERDLSLSNNLLDLMEKVTTALRKIDEGSYGICERCGKPIDKARLKALPYSVLCITCKQQEERFR